jgi:hypothetical protein
MDRIAATSRPRHQSDIPIIIIMSLGGLVILLSVVVILVFKAFLNLCYRFLLTVGFSLRDKMQLPSGQL